MDEFLIFKQVQGFTVFFRRKQAKRMALKSARKVSDHKNQKHINRSQKITEI
jgi:hypothetical protein